MLPWYLASLAISFALKMRALLAENVLGLRLLCFRMMFPMTGKTIEHKGVNSVAMCFFLLQNSVTERGVFHRLMTLCATESAKF